MPTWTSCRKSIKLVPKLISYRRTLLIIRRISPGKQESFLHVELAEIYRSKQRYFKLVGILNSFHRNPAAKSVLWEVCMSWGKRSSVRMCVYINVNTHKHICIGL